MTQTVPGRLMLDAVTSSPAVARRWVIASSRGAPTTSSRRPRSSTTELVTNAVLHAKTAVQVAVDRRDDRVRIEVADQSPTLPTSRRYGEYAGTGRGLMLLDAMAASWGAEPAAGGKVVYFDLMLSGPDSRPAPPSGIVAFDLDG